MLALVFVFVLMDVLGFALVLPLLPYLVSELAAPPSLVGTLLTANAAAQLVGAPLLGSMSDTIGRRPVLIFAACWTCISFALLAVSSSLAMALVSRVLDGLLGGDVSLALAYVSDITTEENRARGLGAVGAAFGLAFILGPVIGGVLVSYSLMAPALLASAIAAANALGLYFWLPESLAKKPAADESATGGLANISRWDPLALLRGALAETGLAPLLILRTGYSFMFIAWEAMFATHYKSVYELPARTVSCILGLVALMYAAVQGGAIAALTKRTRPELLVTVSLAAMGAALGLWLAPLPLAISLGAMAIFGLASGVANTLLNALISVQVPRHRFGSALTLSSALGSLVRVLAPSVVALSFQLTGSHLAAIGLCAAIGLAASAYARSVFAPAKPHVD
ncbi:major facilitator superfamily transporter MFS_1 [Thecamonas trahens ATCC 50062]|uniref:Major facilitator superfamily transporter MFS_1 n=1 Tax=Thecamonas trahens ATCC 50062 TaxID=461836 RepID=A0A0L0DVF7_THETB|nr:major facilitator superfamily transporter MFS_1 [Thecamonas trahens ATCC 50062]KNC56152.1 major facilitator superfamily transporter MFS_1 [Thecamonas trahens ATCC 50062]|eukprot:XP_013761189.1 major facilitator superfamily transporter MFS_1 [Thecamonas trahens ATCC 50062]